MTKKRIFLLLFSVLITIILIGCNNQSNTNNQTSDNQSTPEKNDDGGEENSEVSGEFQVGIPAQPPSLDGHLTNSIATVYVTRQVFETLITINSNFEMVPQLAESLDISEDGKTYTFVLREGITFHNGKEMTAEDVVASMNRWKEKDGALISSIKDGEFEVVDDYTVTLNVNEPSALIVDSLAAHPRAFIMPKEVIEAADDDTGVHEFIGTGPFEFVEWKHDQYIHLTRYEDYEPLDEPADGLAGKKEALVNDIYFQIVPDAGTLVAGIQSGEYDIVLDVPNENYEQLNNNPDLKTDVTMYGALSMAFNKYEGIFTDVKMRQAVSAALDIDSILLAAFANEDLFDGYSSYMQKEQVDWYSDAGSEYYNQNDQEKAKKLLEEAGYNGEEIKVLTTRDYDHIYNSSVVVQEQLSNVGMNVKLEVYDWATFTEIRQDPSQWDVYTSGNAGKPTPVDWGFFANDYFDGPNDDKTNELLNKIEVSTNREEAQELWNELQEYLWETVPLISYGYFPKITGTSKHVDGYEYINGGPVLWNTTNTK